MDSSTTSDQFYFWIAIHGLFMFVAWGMLVPCGIYMARYCRSCLGSDWIVYHRLCMTFALVFSIAAATIALVVGDTHFDRPHKIIGPLVNLALVAQVVWGSLFVRSAPNIGGMGGGKRWQRQLHRIAGPIILLVALTNALLGMIDHGGLPKYVPIAGAMYLVVLAGIFAKAEYSHSDRNNWAGEAIPSSPTAIDDAIATRIEAPTNRLN